MSDRSLRIRLNLQYDHSFGELSPYFEGLSNGRAMARRCKDCGRVWFPPHTLCPEDSGFCDWLELEGNGLVISVTATCSLLPFTKNYTNNIFLMVAMAGATNAAFGKLLPTGEPAAPGDRVHLVKSIESDGCLAQVAIFEVLKEKR